MILNNIKYYDLSNIFAHIGMTSDKIEFMFLNQIDNLPI